MAQFRLAKVQDAEALIEIIKQYIETPITLEYVVPSVRDMESQILSISHDYPFVVVEEEGNIIGYAYAHLNKDLTALSWNAEITAFIDLNRRGRGFGLVATEILIDILRLQGVRNVYSMVTEGNPRSASLHRKLGFSGCGTFHRTGYKNGRWLDLNLYERRISDESSDAEPQAFVEMSRLSKEAVNKILEKRNADLNAPKKFF